MIHVAILDDHQIIIDGIKALLEADERVHIELSGTDQRFFMEALKRQDPIDVFLLDIELKEGNGIELIPQIKVLYPEAEILMLTMHRESKFIQQAVQQGASGYLLKNTNKDNLMEAIFRVYTGKPAYSPEIIHSFIKTPLESHPEPPETEMPSLTQKEADVMRLIKGGLKNAQIATELFVSEETIKTHRKNILFKGKTAGLKNMYEILSFLIENGRL